jgi:hypothetical protein
VNETAAVGSLIYHAEFSDGDEGVAGVMTISLSGCADVFAFHAVTGDVTLNQPLDFSRKRLHSCLVTATDGGAPPLTGVTSLLVTVSDVNNHAPLFLNDDPLRLRIYEDASPGAVLAIMLAVDGDDGDNAAVTYDLVSASPSNVFSLGASTGILTLTSSVDPTTTSTFTLLIRASDHGSPPLSSPKTVVMDVVDVNDHAPVLSVTSQDIYVDRMTSRGTALATLTVQDEDDGENGRVTFAIVAGKKRMNE